MWLHKNRKTMLCDFEHTVCGCVCFRLKAFMCHCQYNMFAFPLSVARLSLVSQSLSCSSPHLYSVLFWPRGVSGPFFYFASASEEKKALPLSLQSLQFFRGAALIFHHASNASPRPQMIFQFIYFNISAGSSNPNWSPVVPSRAQELVGKNRASDSFTQCCCC